MIFKYKTVIAVFNLCHNYSKYAEPLAAASQQKEQLCASHSQDLYRENELSVEYPNGQARNSLTNYLFYHCCNCDTFLAAKAIFSVARLLINQNVKALKLLHRKPFGALRLNANNATMNR